MRDNHSLFSIFVAPPSSRGEGSSFNYLSFFLGEGLTCLFFCSLGSLHTEHTEYKEVYLTKHTMWGPMLIDSRSV